MVKLLTDPALLMAVLVAIAVFATVFTLVPAFGRDPLKSRMKSVAIERDELRAKQRIVLRLRRIVGERDFVKSSQSVCAQSWIGWIFVARWSTRATLNKLKVAGFRGQNPLTKFLFFRLTLPFVFFGLALIYLFVMGGLPKQPTLVKLGVSVGAAYFGFYAPIIYITNRASKRKQSIQRAWPDALDLMLICVESGMSTEAAMRKVADEIGVQSLELAEELILTNAELSYLPDRKQAYDNLANRTGLKSVKSVMQALVQAERYGTPIAHALRVLAAESRDMRLNEAEKKAAALPPKLTVPMILFFLPVLFAVILGPAMMKISDNGGIFGKQEKTNVQNE